MPDPALQQLKDIHLPFAIHAWPIAPGWVMLYIAIAILMSYAVYLWHQRKKRRYTVNYALKQLKQLQELTQNNPDNINIAAEISILIRRTALSYFQRDVIAGLSGQAWLKFLNESGCTNQFTQAGQLLIDAPYQKHNSIDIAPLFALTQNWLQAIAKKGK